MESPPTPHLLSSIVDPLALLEGLFEKSPVAFQVYRASGQSLFVNEAFRALFGSEPPPHYNILADDVLERQGSLATVRRAFAGETIQMPAFWYDPRELKQIEVTEGRRVAIEATFFPLRDASGGVHHVAVCFKDVTAELVRTAEQERYRILAESSRLFAATATDPERALRVITEQIGRVLGETCLIRMIDPAGEVLEPPIAIYTVGDATTRAERERVARLPARVGEGFLGGIAKSGKARLIPHIPTSEHIASIPGETRARMDASAMRSILGIPFSIGGRVIGVLCVARGDSMPPLTEEDFSFAQDLVDRGALVLETARLVRELGRRAEERGRARDLANEELDAFTYSVAHDLRTPLRAIDGFSAALIEDYAGRLDDEGKQYLERARMASQRMGELIDDLVDLARVNRVAMAASSVDLSALATELGAALSKAEPARTVALEIEPGLAARGDPKLVRLALEHLLDNAWKFTASVDGATICVGRSKPNDAFFVRDNGIGFDLDHAAQLFVPFSRVHPAKEHRGMGIGLATVHRVVSRHGGRVWAEAAPNRGATFYFTLPPTSSP